MGKLAAVLAALRYGSSLSDPAVWKRRQNLTNALVGLLGAITLFLPVEVTDADIAALAGGLAVAVGLLNAYLTTATSDKVGLPTRPAPADRQRDADPGP